MKLNKTMARKEFIDKAAREFAKKSIQDKGIAYLEFIEASEWADRTMIDKACEWLRGYLSYEGINEAWSEILITNFRKAMEE